MTRLLKIADWHVPDADTNVHASIASLGEALISYWYGTTPPRRPFSGTEFVGRAHGCDSRQRRIRQESTKTEWALELFGPLFDEIGNGGFIQFVDNMPFVLDETTLMLSAFGPREAHDSFWKMVKPLSEKVKPYRDQFITANGQVDEDFWISVDDLVDTYYRDPVAPEVEEEWTRNYVGKGNLFGANHSFGEYSSSEPWATTIARNILVFAIESAPDLGVELTYKAPLL